MSADEFSVQRYEDLRAWALGAKVQASEARGLNVLMRYGMARWMRTWEECITDTPHQSGSIADGPLLVAGTWEADVTILLSNMAMCQLQEQV